MTQRPAPETPAPLTCKHCQRPIAPADIRPRTVPTNLDTAYPAHDDPDGGCVHCTPVREESSR